MKTNRRPPLIQVAWEMYSQIDHFDNFTAEELKEVQLAFYDGAWALLEALQTVQTLHGTVMVLDTVAAELEVLRRR